MILRKKPKLLKYFQTRYPDLKPNEISAQSAATADMSWVFLTTACE